MKTCGDLIKFCNQLTLVKETVLEKLLLLLSHFSRV